MAELERLVQKVEGDVSGHSRAMDRANRNMNRFDKQTQKTTRNVSDSFRNMASSAAVLDGPLSAVAGRFGALSAAFSRFSGLAVGAGVVFGAMARQIGRGITEFAQAERQMLRLEGIIAATGGAAGITAREMEMMSRRIARSTLQSTTGMRNAIGILGTFRSISGDTFRESAALLADLAEAMGSDVRGAAIQLGRVLEAPASSFGALTRAGVIFTAQQQEVIKNMVETNRVGEAQRRVLEAIRDQVGGVGAAAGAGLAGAFDGANQSIEEFNKTLGELFDVEQRFRNFENRLARITRAIRRVGEFFGVLERERGPTATEARQAQERSARQRFEEQSAIRSAEFNQQVIERNRAIDEALQKEQTKVLRDIKTAIDEQTQEIRSSVTLGVAR